jgi:thioredoxin reductase (NADPH)
VVKLQKGGIILTDLIIIGGGPAGVTAAVYAARAGFSTTIIYRDFGALEKAEKVENFYGFTKISGKSLVEKGLRQARKFGAKTVKGEVVGLVNNEEITVKTTKNEIRSRALLIATGASRYVPKIEGLAELEGRGVSYCAICDGFFYKGKDVAVLGGGAYALHEVADLLPLAESVTVLTNGSEPTVSFPKSVTVRTEKIQKVNKIAIQSLSPKSSNFSGITFEGGEELPFAGLFIAEGTAGAAEFARKIGIPLSPSGDILTDENQRTIIPKIWAAGDCTGGLKQIVKASHEGAISAQSIIKFLRKGTTT